MTVVNGAHFSSSTVYRQRDSNDPNRDERQLPPVECLVTGLMAEFEPLT